MGIIIELIKQFVKAPFTNQFPQKYAPDKISQLKIINNPVAVPPDYRGKIKYDVNKCIGCKMCITVCPANAMEFRNKQKKIKHHVLRCTMCALCVDACPVNALNSSKEFLLASEKKNNQDYIVK